MSEGEVLVICGQGQGQQVGLSKRETCPAELAETLVAVAGTTGRKLQFGAELRDSTAGVVVNQQRRLKLAQHAALRCDRPLITTPMPHLPSLKVQEPLLVDVRPGLRMAPVSRPGDWCAIGRGALQLALRQPRFPMMNPESRALNDRWCGTPPRKT